MLDRSFSKNRKAVDTAYEDVTCCQEWLFFRILEIGWFVKIGKGTLRQRFVVSWKQNVRSKHVLFC